MHTVYSAPIDCPLSTPANEVNSFSGWDSRPRSISHASALSRAVTDRVFLVTDSDGVVIWRSSTH